MLPFPICFRTFPSYILSCFALNILICSYCISVRNIAVNLALFVASDGGWTDIGVYLYTGVVLVVALFNLYARRAISFVTE